MSTAAPVRRWSTDDVPTRMRFDYWANVLRNTLEPMSVTAADVRQFRAQTSATALGALTVIHNQGEAHRSRRASRELNGSAQRSYYLLVSRAGSWSLTHCGHRQLHRGDLILIDSLQPQEIDVTQPFDIVNVKLPEHWLRAWLPEPARLVGRRIPGESPWGAAMSCFIKQLTPDCVTRAILPPEVLADQVGALLALVAGHWDAPSFRGRALERRITEQVQARCRESDLSASGIAIDLNVAPALIHRTLGRKGTTFVELLRAARTQLRTVSQGLMPGEPTLSPTAALGYDFAGPAKRRILNREKTGDD
jgi:AraC family transcriptional regulator, positive regulator of tynA and feaB